MYCKKCKKEFRNTKYKYCPICHTSLGKKRKKDNDEKKIENISKWLLIIPFPLMLVMIGFFILMPCLMISCFFIIYGNVNYPSNKEFKKLFWIWSSVFGVVVFSLGYLALFK